jgi:hypothetical protein
MDSGVMIHQVSNRLFQKFLGTDIHTDTQTHKQQGDLTSLFSFFQEKESRLKNNYTEDGPSWEANSHSAGQEILWLLSDLKVHDYVNPPLDHVLNQLNSQFIS